MEHGADEFPDVGEVMVVVLGDEIEMVDEAHGSLQARVRNGTGEEGMVYVFDAVQKDCSGCTEVREDLFEGVVVVFGEFGFAIGEVSCSELVAGEQVIADASKPERFEVEQVAGVFLSRPFLLRLGGECFVGMAAKGVFEPSGSAAEAGAEIGEEFQLEGEFECAFEPEARLSHVGLRG